MMWLQLTSLAFAPACNHLALTCSFAQHSYLVSAETTAAKSTKSASTFADANAEHGEGGGGGGKSQKDHTASDAAAFDQSLFHKKYATA